MSVFKEDSLKRVGVEALGLGTDIAILGVAAIGAAAITIVTKARITKAHKSIINIKNILQTDIRDYREEMAALAEEAGIE